MAITVNSPGMGSRRFGSGDKQAFCQAAHAGQSCCMEGCSSRHEIMGGKMYQPVGLGGEGG